MKKEIATGNVEEAMHLFVIFTPSDKRLIIGKQFVFITPNYPIFRGLCINENHTAEHVIG